MTLPKQYPPRPCKNPRCKEFSTRKSGYHSPACRAADIALILRAQRAATMPAIEPRECSRDGCTIIFTPTRQQKGMAFCSKLCRQLTWAHRKAAERKAERDGLGIMTPGPHVHPLTFTNGRSSAWESPLHGLSFDQRMAEIVRAAQHPAYNPRKCTEFLREAMAR